MNNIKSDSKDRKATTVVCHKCNRSRQIDISKYTEQYGFIKGILTCKCGQKYNFVVDRRKYLRKDLNIKGIFVVTTDLEQFQIYGSDSENSQSNALVKDISITGLKLEFKEQPDIKVNDKMLIEFFLDEKQNDLIRKEVIVRNIEGVTIGVEFIDHHLENQMNRKIGGYVLNKNMNFP